jgi:hypothetical protein
VKRHTYGAEITPRESPFDQAPLERKRCSALGKIWRSLRADRHGNKRNCHFLTTESTKQALSFSGNSPENRQQMIIRQEINWQCIGPSPLYVRPISVNSKVAITAWRGERITMNNSLIAQ